MVKQEINEIKKLFKQSNCSITRICGCYVDGEKNKKTEFKEAFLALPEEEMFKYFEILKKSLSGTLGKNMINLEFPLASEAAGGTQEFLLKLRDSKLKDDALLDEYYDKIIESYEYVGNYLILVIHDAYDVPGRTSDGIDMEDASDEVYEYILTSICPVNLSKPGLSYNAVENTFQNRVRDWVVDMPETAFLFPAFNDRSTDLHSTLYYSKNAELLKESFIENLLGCPLPLSAGNQKETFHTLVEETLGDSCSIETVKSIHEKLNEMVEEHKEELQPLMLDKNEAKTLFAGSGVSNEIMEEFDRHFDETAGEDTSLMVSNVMDARNFEVKTPDVVIKVKSERTDLIETKVIDGLECLVVRLDGGVEVNGITVRSSSPSSDDFQ
jgi:transcriptional regulator of met regulon